MCAWASGKAAGVVRDPLAENEFRFGPGLELDRFA
jgi:hypothetical protein